METRHRWEALHPDHYPAQWVCSRCGVLRHSLGVDGYDYSLDGNNYTGPRPSCSGDLRAALAASRVEMTRQALAVERLQEELGEAKLLLARAGGVR